MVLCLLSGSDILQILLALICLIFPSSVCSRFGYLLKPNCVVLVKEVCLFRIIWVACGSFGIGFALVFKCLGLVPYSSAVLKDLCKLVLLSVGSKINESVFLAYRQALSCLVLLCVSFLLSIFCHCVYLFWQC